MSPKRFQSHRKRYIEYKEKEAKRLLTHDQEETNNLIEFLEKDLEKKKTQLKEWKENNGDPKQMKRLEKVLETVEARIKESKERITQMHQQQNAKG